MSKGARIFVKVELSQWELDDDSAVMRAEISRFEEEEEEEDAGRSTRVVVDLPEAKPIFSITVVSGE